MQKNVSLADYVSWKTSGPAKQFYQVTTLEHLQDFLKTLPDDESLLWLGLGSNILIREGGFNGTVIFTQKGMREIEQINETQIRAEAGVACPTLARFAAKHSLVGGEWFAGIPGTVGGALQMNGGAFGGETWEHVVSVETIDQAGNLHIRSPKDYEVSYRHVKGPEKEWFIAATFEFKPGNKERALLKIKGLLNQRAATQPTGLPTCGSVFRNPEDDYAARLIEACDLKGHQQGDAMVSQKHANFIVNTENATPKDIETLINYVAKKVNDVYSIELVREVKIVGDEK